MKKRLTALLFIVVLLTTLFPMTASEPQETEAANYIIDGITTIVFDEDGTHELYRATLTTEGLKIRAEYFYNSTATLSYHTKYLYFTVAYSNSNPTGLGNKCRTFSATRLGTEYDEESNKTYETFYVPAAMIEQYARELCGTDALRNPEGVTLYMSQGFVLKRRNSATAEWKIDNGPVYNTLTGIRGAANWSYDTLYNFAGYFDVPIKVVSKSTLNVTSTEGGVAYGSGNYFAGETVSISAVASSGYYFDGWTGTKAGIDGVDWTEEKVTFIMPAKDITLTANFEKSPGVIPTRAPVATATPEPTRPPGVTATPSPSPKPTATPIPTPAPPYIPDVSSEIYKKHIRYYTTDAGYTMEKIYNDDGYLAGMEGVETEGRIQSGKYTKLDTNYLVGSDTSGNTWYFQISGSNAVYVHPKVYEGNDAGSAQVRNITELIFPSTITCNGTSYTVTSIGGGTMRYKADDYISGYGGPPYIGGQFTTTQGYYSYVENYTSVSGNYVHSQDYGTSINYAYGVIGNGYIISNGHRHFYWSSDGEEAYDNEDYQNDYYVHNTTLKYVTIPDTVTMIADYAFYGCQALEKIIGGNKVATIGESAFEGSDHLVPKLCQNGPQYSFTYYYYNGSYSFDAPTDVMKDWQKNISFSEYMEFVKFPALKTVSTNAFMWHANLFDVVLPSGVSTIGKNAFAGCKLNSITIPGKSTAVTEGANYYDKDGNSYMFEGSSTLGTKGTRDTLIVTVPESNAMYYGLKYNECYTLRAGYEVIYDNNFEPEQTYSSISMLKVLCESAIQNIRLSVTGMGDVHLLIDDDGDLFVYEENRDVIATQIAPGAKFAELKTMPMLHWAGVEYVSCNWYFAVGTNGEIWGCMESSPENWTDFSLPEGAHSIQFSGNRYYAWIYYLDTEGNICCARVTEDDSGVLPVLKLVEHEKIIHDYPSVNASYKFDRIVIENEGESYPGTINGVYYNGTTYGYGAPPQIVAHVASDSSYEPDSLVRFVAFPLKSSYSSIASCYTPPEKITEDCGEFVWLYKQDQSAVGDGALYYTYSGYDIYYVNRNGMLYRAKYENVGGSYRYTTEYIASGGFYDVRNDVNNTFSILTGYGGVYVANHRKKTATLLFQGAEIKEAWGYATAVYPSDYDYSKKDCNFLYILDSRNNLYCVYDTYGTSSSLQQSGTAKLVSNVKKVLHKNANILVLDGDGVVWSIGVNSYGALANYNSYENASYGKDSSYYLRTATKINASVSFSDIYLDESSYGPYYSLAQDVNGNVYAAGYGEEIFGNGSYHYSGYSKVSVSMKNGVDEVYEFLSGYEFRENLYDSMFERDGYDFTSWNTKSDGSGTVYRAGEEILLTAPITVYAQWEKASNKIRYAPNGGSGIMEDDVYDIAITKVTLKKNIYTKKGHEFTGWNTEPDGSGITYKDMAVITIPQGTTVLYAQWKPFPYIVKVAEDDIRVTPVTITDIFELDYGEEMTIPTAMTDKVYTVEYDLNRRSTMSTIPYWKTETPLADLYTKASLSFLGWELYEETVDGYNYIGFYEPGEKVKNLAEEKGNALVLFPYWGGDASYIRLPMAEIVGYDFIGWTTDKNETDEENVIHAEEGSDAQYKPKGNETLYAYYVPKEYEVNLIADIEGAKPGEIVPKQTSVTMTFDRMVPGIMVPESDHYIFLGYFTKPEGEGVQYYDENGRGLQIWRIADGSVTALYAYMIAEVEVTLDGRGATKQEQMTVTMTYEVEGPDIIPPEKTGYTFEGYFTEVRGRGKQYFDENGKGINIWLERDVNILYACWKQNPIELPEKGKENIPDVLPESRIEIEVVLDKVEVNLYADDNNPSTGAETDLQPYLVSDEVVDGKTEVLGAIPSTENIALRAKMGAWMLSAALERKCGIEYVRIHVTVPYRTQYEDAEDETLIISNVQTKTIDFMIPKAWSYWIVESGGMYFPETVVVANDCIEGGKVEVPVQWNISGAAKKTSYQLTSYGDKWTHLNWSQFDADGTASLSITLTEEQYIISDVPGEAPDVTEHLSIVCSNVAWQDKTQLVALSDKLSVEDMVLLSDERKADGNGAVPDTVAIAEVEKKITETTYSQTYQSGIPLLATAKNGRYDTTAEAVYTAGALNVGSETEKRIAATQANEINIHTPVVCIAQIAAGHEGDYQCKEIPQGSTVLVLDEEGIYSDFTLQISNTGYHSSKKGYGTRTYEMYLAQEDSKEQNQVCFPFAVWIDVGNDRENENDILWMEETWYTIGMEKQRFYVPFWIREGEYEIELRSVAVNATDAAEKTEKVRNTQWENYVATENIKVYLTGRLYDFMVYGIEGTAVWEEVREENISYTVGVTEAYGENGEERDLWDTLPLRTGVHPYYKNAGGLPIGGNFSFRLKSIGSVLGDDMVLSIVPELVCLTEQGYEEVDVYFEKETEQGTFLTKWSEEECAFSLLADIDSQPDAECVENLKKTTGGREAIERYGEEIGGAVRYWSGTFSLPDTIYVAEQGSDVLGYQKKYGLSFTEDFWMSKERFMLRFDIRLEKVAGDTLYYGKVPEYIRNNIWCREAGGEPRTDSKGAIYPIYGGEVAVIYPGESGKNDYVTHGIY